MQYIWVLILSSLMISCASNQKELDLLKQTINQQNKMLELLINQKDSSKDKKTNNKLNENDSDEIIKEINSPELLNNERSNSDKDMKVINLGKLSGYNYLLKYNKFGHYQLISDYPFSGNERITLIISNKSQSPETLFFYNSKDSYKAYGDAKSGVFFLTLTILLDKNTKPHKIKLKVNFK